MTQQHKVLVGVGISVACLGLLGAGYVGFIHYVGQPVRMQGRAMEPALRDGDRIIFNKQFGALNRGDIVIFYFPLDPTKSYIKRIVGLPGEQIEVRGGEVLINGQLLEEPYVDQQYNQMLSKMPPTRVPARSFYVLGDNRDNSADSRIWGAVHEKFIYGKLVSKY